MALLQIGWRWLALSAFVTLVACQTGGAAGTSAGGGASGVQLEFGGSADSRDCTDEAGQGGAPTAGDAASLASCGATMIDYTAQVAPILARCTGEVCHDFSEHSSVRAFIGAPADECCNRRALIAPGHPERSYLIDKLEGRRLCYGTAMPQNREPLPAADVAILSAWICQGAALP